jgi:hypothetical protein
MRSSSVGWLLLLWSEMVFAVLAAGDTLPSPPSGADQVESDERCPSRDRSPHCPERPSVIYVSGGSGYEDRLHTFNLFATFANFLCKLMVFRR